MTEEFETEALHYLLNEMEPARRAAFEQQLAGDPTARAALKACADSLARFAHETAAAEAMTPADQRAALAAILSAAGGSARTSNGLTPRIAARSWWGAVWPIAAALLLALNFVEFKRPLAPAVFRDAGAEEGPRRAVDDKNVAIEKTGAGRPGDGSDRGTETAAGAMEKSEATNAGLLANAAENLRQLEQLRTDYANLQRSAAALRNEYDSVMHHVAQQAVLEKTVGRLAGMELVDATRYASGQRRGLLEVARGILTEPGVVVADVGVPPPSTGTPEVGSAIDPPPGGAAPAEAAYAWSVFDDQEHQGYLNLYNLPTIAADQSLQLWVKPVDATVYQRVGEVPPQFYGGSGSVRYELPDTSLPPAEILITQEPRTNTSGQPTGPIVLRGP